MIDVGVQYFQYSVAQSNGQISYGNVTVDLRGKPPFFIPQHCFQKTSSPQMSTNGEKSGKHNQR